MHLLLFAEENQKPTRHAHTRNRAIPCKASWQNHILRKPPNHEQPIPTSQNRKIKKLYNGRGPAPPPATLTGYRITNEIRREHAPHTTGKAQPSPAGTATTTTTSPAHYIPATTTEFLHHRHCPATLASSHPQNADLRVCPPRPDGTIISFRPRRVFNRFDPPSRPRTHQNTHPARQPR